METVIWFGIAAIIVIAVVIAAIGSPGDGPGRHGRSVGGDDTRRRVGSRSGGSAGHSSAYVASGWSDTGSSSCGGDSSGGGCGGGF